MGPPIVTHGRHRLVDNLQERLAPRLTIPSDIETEARSRASGCNVLEPRSRQLLDGAQHAATWSDQTPEILAVDATLEITVSYVIRRTLERRVDRFERAV